MKIQVCLAIICVLTSRVAALKTEKGLENQFPGAHETVGRASVSEHLVPGADAPSTQPHRIVASSPHDAAEKHGHAAHSHSHGHGEGAVNEGLGYSLCLIGAVAFNMSLLYLINNDDAGIKCATWQVLSMTLSIFSAVLAYVTIREICITESIQGPVATMVASMMLFLAIYVLNECVMFLLKAPEYVHVLHAGSAVGCHLLGFAASYAFADLQRSSLFGETFLGNMFVVVVAIAVLAGIAYLARLVHKWVEHLHDDRSARREHLADLRWEREVELMENEAMALCIGYLLVNALAFTIRGSHENADVHLKPEHVTQWQASSILMCAALFSVLSVSGIYAVTMIMKAKGLVKVDTLNFESYASEHTISLDLRFMMILQNAVGVAMAWCLLLWAEWQLYTLGFDGPRSAACMLVGLGLTLLTFAAIFGLEWIAGHIHASGVVDPERVVRSNCLTLGIVVGFAWERAFHVGLEDIGHALPVNAASQTAVTHLMVVILIIIVTPAWAMYVFPMVEISKIPLISDRRKSNSNNSLQSPYSSQQSPDIGPSKSPLNSRGNSKEPC